MNMTKEKKIFLIGLVIGFMMGIISLLLFNDTSFIVGGLAIVVIGFSLLYYIIQVRKN